MPHSGLKVALINMPFAAVRLPSIALTQLRAVAETALEDRVSTEIIYANHDFAKYIGNDVYGKTSDSVKATVIGLGEWLFRPYAFPDLPDNEAEYLRRYAGTISTEDGLLEALRPVRKDIGPFFDELIARYNLLDFDVVGFTSMFAQSVASFALARRIKDADSRIVTVIGGANCETTMGAVIARNVEAIDFVFSGPGLKSFPAFLTHLANGEVEACREVVGVLSREKLDRDGQAGREIGDELDIDADVPLDYDGFLRSLESKCPETSPSLLFETSRGCWWGERSHCTFCGLNGTTMQYRSMAAEKALPQFENLFRYANRVSRYEAVDNILPRKYLKEVLPKLSPPDNVTLFYEVKADLKEHEMELLHDSGIREVQPGIEALASSTLKLMAKGTSAFQNLQFLKYCAVFGIKPVWNLLIGFPGEQESVYEKYAKDLPSFYHLPPPTGVYPVRFDRYSPYFTNAEGYNLELKPYDFYSMVYPFSDHDIEEFAYFFEDRNFHNQYIALTAKWLRRLEALITEWRGRWRMPGADVRVAQEWRGETQIIADTRGGRLIEHEIDSAGFELLAALSQPRTDKQLLKMFEHVPEELFRANLGNLCDRRLVFEEDGRYMNLLIHSDRDQGYI